VPEVPSTATAPIRSSDVSSPSRARTARQVAAQVQGSSVRVPWSAIAALANAKGWPVEASTAARTLPVPTWIPARR
jgi:hypothetical protein